jgi:hypothetical protein
LSSEDTLSVEERYDVIKQFYSSVVKVSRVKVITIGPSGMLEYGRIVDAIRMHVLRLGVNSFVQTIRGAFVQQIEPAKDAMRTEDVAKLFITPFGQICALKESDKLVPRSLSKSWR